MDPQLPSRISAVTVFTSGALVTRQVDLANLPETAGRIRICGLPLSLDDSSVRLRILGGSAIAKDLSILLEVPPTNGCLAPAVNQALNDARGLVARRRLEISLIDERLEQLDRIELPERPSPARGSPPLSSPTAARLAVVSFRRREAQALIAQRVGLREELRLAQERLSELESQDQIASTARMARTHQVRKTVVAHLAWGDAMPAGSLQLDYLVPGARWVPSYTIRIANDLSRAMISVMGSVVQDTGEDWNEVQLTASTAAALAWSDLPELSSLRIGRRQAPERKTGWREPPCGAEQLYLDFDRYRKQLIAAKESLRAQESPAPQQRDMAAMTFGGEIAKPTAKKTRSESESDRGGAAVSADRDEGAMVGSESMAPPPSGAQAPGRSMGRRPSPSFKSDLSKEAYDDNDSDRRRIGGVMVDALTLRDQEADTRTAADHPVDDLLAYGRLYLPDAADARRGLLHVRPAWMAVNRGSPFAVSVHIDVEAKLQLASIQSQAVEALAVPPGCHAVATPQFAYSYPSVSLASIPSDHSWHLLALGEGTASTRLEHVTVPREAREVFRVLHLTNPFTNPLLPGPADVYIAEAYLMTADVALTIPGGSLELGLGVEQGITVARNTTYQEETTGMLSGNLALHHGISITVANKLRTAVSLEVRERLPVATPGQDDCKVKLGNITPAWEAYQQDALHLLGGHRWKLQLPAGATQTLSAAYTVTIPSKSEITAGNRREA